MASNALLILIAAAALSACSAIPLMDTRSAIDSEEFAIVITDEQDSLESLALKWLGSEQEAWQIAELNRVNDIRPGQQIAIPLKPVNPTGFFLHGHQRVPVLCYHRFDNRHEKLSVTAEQFRQQMQYLQDNGYHVIPLSYLIDFVEGKRALPPKSVVITIDDGYRSTYEVAFPILKQFNFPATVFLYTDFLNARDALKWKQIEEMHASELVAFQPHSKTHPNMSLKQAKETQQQYSQRVNTEIRQPEESIRRHLNNTIHTFAYPFGDTNSLIISRLQQRQYKLGVTVQPGSNAAFAYPFMLKRTMIFGDFNEEDFARSLETFRRYGKG